MFRDNSDYFIYFCDDYTAKAYINKIININAIQPYDLLNFQKIENDLQFNAYDKWIKNNFNYDHIHANEKIDGVI